ncbi:MULTISPECIES: TraB/GumN family protein [unclassified Methanoculleus]|uniref:TraB/GumN family protein n=1 Tax=unclassified Methanoculleus TaxID=2619537 RepID=UPI0025CF7536|nr:MULTISPECIES: TraB/GumN family protein [unclassified Methanoculleus]MCK9318693.1 TraB/GumN family protein [Methanoculleus sp.]MDD2254460.1 TraB/GumN family protein [Methanoculleus sp.]MDD2787389.1 TraB/GumN family protein [Methanoculleus sp.]MDD3216693.1 TraB/GumN family protein [Methanoculleus sp.]MDD4315068.1 TraB/GumN family protein [Methanoculleus sp.]
MTEIRLVGTAHVSQKSVEDVRSAIEEFGPDIVGVELDRGRYTALTEEVAEPSVADVLKGGNFGQLLVQWVLTYIQQRIGAETGVKPGTEMLTAIDEAKAHQKPVAFIDRDIRITLARFWGNMGIWEKFKFIGALLYSLVNVEGEEIDVDTLTNQDVVSAAMEEFRKFSPRGAQALIDERDAYLAHQVLMLGGRYERVLAVVGAGHIRGVQRYLDAPETLPPLPALTAESKGLPWGKILGAAVTGLFLLLFAAIAFSGVGLDILLAAFVYWILITGALSAVFTLLAGGHPLSAATAFAVSWMTSLNPLLAAGWFAAAVEAKIRKPTAGELRQIIAAETFSEMRKIPLFRVVLVAALANVGCTIGVIAYFLFIFPVLGIDPTVVITDGFSNMLQMIQGLF